MNFHPTALATCIILASFLGPLSTLAQEKQSDNPIKVQTTLVSVPVIVSDRQGRYISGLKLSDFKFHLLRVQVNNPDAVVRARRSYQAASFANGS